MLHGITYNIHFGKRLTDITQWINNQKTTDVICLQEFPKHKLTDFYKNLSRDWGHRDTPSFVLRKKIYCLVMIYRKKSLRVLTSETLHMGVHPMEKKLLGNPMEKSCLFITFRYGTKTITIANTHLVFLAANRSRYKQIQMIVDHGSKHRHPFIITGDFNIPSVRAKNTLISHMKTLGFQTISKRLRTFRIAGWKWQLDYVFVKHCRLSSLTLEKLRFSDHYPLISEVHL